MVSGSVIAARNRRTTRGRVPRDETVVVRPPEARRGKSRRWLTPDVMRRLTPPSPIRSHKSQNTVLTIRPTRGHVSNSIRHHREIAAPARETSPGQSCQPRCPPAYGGSQLPVPWVEDEAQIFQPARDECARAAPAGISVDALQQRRNHRHGLRERLDPSDTERYGRKRPSLRPRGVMT